MADNFGTNASGLLPDTQFAADEIGGVKHQRVKVQHGADGSAVDASSANPLPVRVESTALAALAAATDSVAVFRGVNALYDGATQIVPKRAVISSGNAGDNLLVASVSGKKIRVIALMLMASADVTAILRSGTTNISGSLPLPARGGFSLPENVYGWVETAASSPLNLNLSSAVQTGGMLTYIEVA